MDTPQTPREPDPGPHFSDQPPTPADEGRAWEEIEPGRHMPRRIRGSFKGRALG